MHLKDIQIIKHLNQFGVTVAVVSQKKIGWVSRQVEVLTCLGGS